MRAPGAHGGVGGVRLGIDDLGVEITGRRVGPEGTWTGRQMADPAHRPRNDVCDRLGDRILVVGQREGVPGRQIVAPSHTDVLDPIPGREATQESRQLPLLTLTTCHPQFSAAERLIVHAVLVDTTDKSDGGPPPALEGR